jgi:hypothetical protein
VLSGIDVSLLVMAVGTGVPAAGEMADAPADGPPPLGEFLAICGGFARSGAA